MTKEEIKEGNKLIAEFMGGKYIRDENLAYEPKGKWENIDKNLFVCGNQQDYNLKYNSSWNWLMPVCIKLGMKFISTDIVLTYKNVINEIRNLEKN